MSFSGLQWGQWCLIALAAVVLLVPVGLAAVAPALAPLPASASVPGWEASPLPDRETPLPGFQHLLDPVPLVVRDLPDDASGQVVEAYDRATLFDPQPSHDMLAAAGNAIPVPSAFEVTWNAWLLDLNAESDDPAAVPEVIPDEILGVLRDDPLNGDRLNNLAVALYFSGLTDNDGTHNAQVVANTLGLLGAALQTFPDSRSLVINYAFLSRFYIASGDSDPARVLSPIDTLAAWSDAHPDDVTALHLLVTNYLGEYDSVPETIMAQLGQLTESSDLPRAALGHALLGDLRLSAARAQLGLSPFSAQQTARQALQEYDGALIFSDDPSIYSARAATLEILGDISSAIESQQRAVELAPDSVFFRTLLSERYMEQGRDQIETQGALHQTQDSARAALEIAASQRDPLISHVQLLHYWDWTEYTAFRPERTYLLLGSTGYGGGRGAGFIISNDLIPMFRYEPVVINYPGLTARQPADRAAHSAIIASVALGDPRGVEDAGKLLRPTDEIPELRERLIPAAELVADLPTPSVLDSGIALFSADMLRYAGLPAQAAMLCRVAIEDSNISAEQRSSLLTCLGETAFLAGEYDVARQVFAELGSPLYEGYVAEVAGDTDEAVRLYTPLASNTSGDFETREASLRRLGDIYLGRGDEQGAMALYDQAVLMWAPSGSTPESLKLQHLRNNRGVARLKSLASPGSAPDCTGGAATACADALADFEAALLSDPYNPVYLLGKGWVERLLGDSGAAMQTLTQAVQVDPEMFAAQNDLGVLAVQSEDLPRAQQAFLDALAANPQYDLALWNLGVLEMQRGVSGVPRGQAYLARAIVQNPSLVSSGLSYQTDEEIYRVEFNERLRPGAGWSFASSTSIATTAFGFIAVLTIILRGVVYLSTDKVQGAASTWAANAVEWLDRRMGRTLTLSSRDGLNRWLPLLITLPVLAFVTSWSALREAPGVASAHVSLALFAALAAVIVHEVGHILVAWKLKAKLRPAQWGPGTLLALVLLPVQLNAGPFPGQRVDCEDEEAVWRVRLAGPLANFLVALGAYALFFFQPMPGLRLIAMVQLAAVSYAMLPFDSLDGAALSRSRPMVGGGLASLVLLAGLLLTVGVL